MILRFVESIYDSKILSKNTKNAKFTFYICLSCIIKFVFLFLKKIKKSKKNIY